MNLYGDQPIWVGSNGGNSFGGIWWNSNAKSFVLNKQRRLTLRSNGGIFDIFLMQGPNGDTRVDDIIKEIHTIVGPSIKMPMWSFGYHLCRWGYGSAQNTFKIANQLRKAGIPQEAQWNDIGIAKMYES